MIDLDEYKRLRARVDSLRRESDKAQGALEQLTGRLRDEFGCKTVAEAGRLLKRKEREAAEAELKFAAALEAFDDEWGGELEDGDA